MRRAVVGVWHQINVKHFGRYASEATFRWNRESDGVLARMAARCGTATGGSCPTPTSRGRRAPPDTAFPHQNRASARPSRRPPTAQYDGHEGARNPRSTGGLLTWCRFARAQAMAAVLRDGTVQQEPRRRQGDVCRRHWISSTGADVSEAGRGAVGLVAIQQSQRVPRHGERQQSRSRQACRATIQATTLVVDAISIRPHRRTINATPEWAKITTDSTLYPRSPDGHLDI